ALHGQWYCLAQRAHLQEAQPSADELVRGAQDHSDRDGLVEGYRILAVTCFHLGNFRRALQYVRQGLALHNAKTHSSQVFLDGQDPGVCSLVWHGWLEWYLGSTDRALVS